MIYSTAMVLVSSLRRLFASNCGESRAEIRTSTVNHKLIPPANSQAKVSLMAYTPPRQEIATLRKSFFDEELLNRQFASLEEVGRLPSNRNPQFAEEVSTLYFRDSADVIASMERTLEKAPVDFSMIDMNLHHLKSGSVSIGANKVTIQVNLLRKYFEQHNLDSFKGTIEQLKLELAYLKSKLVHYFQLLRQAEPVEAAERPV